MSGPQDLLLAAFFISGWRPEPTAVGVQLGGCSTDKSVVQWEGFDPLRNGGRIGPPQTVPAGAAALPSMLNRFLPLHSRHSVKRGRRDAPAARPPS